jgi:Flp pilus assembly protein TadD
VSQQICDYPCTDKVFKVPSEVQDLLERKNPDIQRAAQLVALTPLDCYDCVRERGLFDASTNHLAAAAWWYARAAGMAPSLPTAYVQWGEMFLYNGNPKGAADKFAEAARRSPHDADALERWGEALNEENQFGAAVAKFEEANNYAPKWSQLHSAWGYALCKLHREDEARRQYAIAAVFGDHSISDCPQHEKAS